MLQAHKGSGLLPFFGRHCNGTHKENINEKGKDKEEAYKIPYDWVFFRYIIQPVFGYF